MNRTEAIAAVDRAQKTCCGYLGSKWDKLQSIAFDEGAPDCAHNRVIIDRAQGTETCEDCGAENPRGALRYPCSCGASLEPDYTRGDHSDECPARKNP